MSTTTVKIQHMFTTKISCAFLYSHSNFPLCPFQTLATIKLFFCIILSFQEFYIHGISLWPLGLAFPLVQFWDPSNSLPVSVACSFLLLSSILLLSATTVDMPLFVQPLANWKPLELFQVWGYYENSFYEHLCIDFLWI